MPAIADIAIARRLIGPRRRHSVADTRRSTGSPYTERQKTPVAGDTADQR
jgi:hypothetical protein